MGLTLVKFGQEVDVATGSLDVSYFAIFQADNGLTLKLPLTESASQALISFYATAKAPQEMEVTAELRQAAADEMAEEEDQSAATVFQAEDEEDQDESDDDDYDSEEAVPSL